MRINEEYNIPYYIFEEIVKYVEMKAKGKEDIIQRERIKTFVRLAEINERITESQADDLIRKFCKD